MYFAWLGYYTAALIPAAIVGFFIFVYGVASMPYDEPRCGPFHACPTDENGMKPSCLFLVMIFAMRMEWARR